MPRIVAVQHDDLPAARRKGAAHLKGRLREALTHRLGLIVISRDAQHRFARIAEHAAKAQIARGVVLHDVARHEHGGVTRHTRESGIEHALETCGGFHAAQLPLRAAVQVRIRDLKNLHGRNPSKVTRG